MSVATPSAGTTSQGMTKAKRPRSNRLAKVRVHLANIYWLMIKELRSIRSDPIMLALVAYSFTIAIYAVATGASTEATNLSVGIVDEDHSDLSRRIADGLTPPTFKPAVEIAATEIDASMDSERFIFVIEIPPKFQEDILSGRQPSVQINVDATAVAHRERHRQLRHRVRHRTRGADGRAGQDRDPRKVQPELEIELVLLGDAGHQQSHHAHRDLDRSRAHPRA